MDDTPPSSDDNDATSDPQVPHLALSGRRARPPAKVFATKSLASRSLVIGEKTSGTLLERLHGPRVKWPAAEARKAARVSAPQETPAAPAAPQVRGTNMSERFISERLLSDRGATFNPQIPRRVPEIPNSASGKASEADVEGKRLIVGKLVRLSGEIGGCERLIVEGTAEVTLHGVKTLEIGATGTFKGTAEIETANVAGTFEGTLKVSGHLDIGPGATVRGTVSYGTITVASGGKLLGTIESAS